MALQPIIRSHLQQMLLHAFKFKCIVTIALSELSFLPFILISKKYQWVIRIILFKDFLAVLTFPIRLGGFISR